MGALIHLGPSRDQDGILYACLSDSGIRELISNIGRTNRTKFSEKGYPEPEFSANSFFTALFRPLVTYRCCKHPASTQQAPSKYPASIPQVPPQVWAILNAAALGCLLYTSPSPRD